MNNTIGLACKLGGIAQTDKVIDLVAACKGVVTGNVGGANNTTVQGVCGKALDGLSLNIKSKVSNTLCKKFRFLSREGEFFLRQFTSGGERSNTDRHCIALDRQVFVGNVKVVVNGTTITDGNHHGIAGHLFSTELRFDVTITFTENVRADVELNSEFSHDTGGNNVLSRRSHYLPRL